MTLASYECIKEKNLKTHILKAIKSFNDVYESASRTKIKTVLDDQDLSLSDQQIRHVLEKLAQDGMITRKRGRYGTQITEKGITFLS